MLWASEFDLQSDCLVGSIPTYSTIIEVEASGASF